MQTIKQILDEKNKIVNKERARKYAEVIPPEYYLLKDKINILNGDIKEIITNAEPDQIDSHDENRVVVNIDGFKNEKIGSMRYLIQLIAYFDNGNLIKGHIIGMLNNYNKCYIRDLFGNFDVKPLKSGAKELF